VPRFIVRVRFPRFFVFSVWAAFSQAKKESKKAWAGNEVGNEVRFAPIIFKKKLQHRYQVHAASLSQRVRPRTTSIFGKARFLWQTEP
jgi:hypothetical protein